MRKLLFLCVLAFSFAAYAAIPQDGIQGRFPSLSDHEEEMYTKVDNIRHQEVRQQWIRDGEVTRILQNGQEVIKITQSKDGRQTTWEFINSPIVKRMDFPVPIFELPNGSQVWGVIYNQVKGNPTKILPKNIAVKVERNITSVTYSYLYLSPVGFREIEKITYVGTSQLPIQSEMMVIVPYRGKEGIAVHMSLIRDIK